MKMTLTPRYNFVTLFVLMLCLASSTLLATTADKLALIKLPKGFKISLFADDVEGARSLAKSPAGTIFVGTRHAGNVYALQDTDNDGQADKRYLIASGLNMPNGVAFHEGDLYVAEVDKILRFDAIETALNKPPQPTLIFDELPGIRHHGWKFIRFGPDKKLYIPIGAPCNVCNPSDQRYATISRLDPDGRNWEIVARGIRNSVGFDWSQKTNLLWFTDNGRDYMGDQLPADELNVITAQNQHFGFPFCHQGDLLDPEFGQGHDCKQYQAPAFRFAAHSANLGMRFYTAQLFPEKYHQRIFVAQHGSWNRSTPIGYRIVSLEVSDTRAFNYEVFASGWLQNNKAWGRPVDIEMLDDGSLLISDDYANAIYRIYYQLD